MSQIKPVPGPICKMERRCWGLPQAYGRDQSQIKAFLKTENNEYVGKRVKSESFFLSAKKKFFIKHIICSFAEKELSGLVLAD